MNRVWWRGVQLDEQTRDMMVEAERISGVRITPTQGSWSDASPSAGTHTGSGAIDLDVRGLPGSRINQLVAAMRRVGAAAWYRRSSQGPWIPHIHSITVNVPGLSYSASRQVADYYNGLNGLANRGPDDGPRDWVGMTWQKYQQQPEQEPITMIVFFQIRRSDGTLSKTNEAQLTCGTWYELPDDASFSGRMSMLKDNGVPFKKAGAVADARVFGRQVPGPGAQEF